MRQSNVDRKRKQPVTYEEINQLKITKNELMEEKKTLKTKIARLQFQNKKGNRSGYTGKNLIDSLEKYKNTLESIVENQKKDFKKIKKSDSAVLCFELQEETKLVFLERNRVIDLQQEKMRQLNQSENIIKALQNEYSTKAINLQKEKIQFLSAKLRKYNLANQRIQQKIEEARMEDSDEVEAYQLEVEKRAKSLKYRIEQVKNARKANERQYNENMKEHEMVIKDLRKQYGLPDTDDS